MTAPDLYEFEMRVVRKDPTGYYHVRWDRAQRITVIAENSDAAYTKVWAVMGKADRGWVWTATIDRIRDHRLAEAATP